MINTHVYSECSDLSHHSKSANPIRQKANHSDKIWQCTLSNSVGNWSS